MSRDTWVAFSDVRVEAATDLALLVDFGDERVEWIPKSCMHEDSTVAEKHDEGVIVISGWIAEQRDLEGEEYP